MHHKLKTHLFRYSRSLQWVSCYIFILYRFFYKNIVVVGRENIPPKGPLIFAPNHQNALMDPLAVLYASGMQIVFLARADIFRKPLLRRIFTWLKILPVYRIRDGKENLQNNEQSFDLAIEVLEHGRSIGIFPEAAHSNKRSLLPLKKGVPRVAFLAEEKNDFKLGLKIVPVGIYYSSYETMGGILHIRYGEPIDLQKFQADYNQNPQKAHLLLRDAIATGIRPLAIDISKKDWYDVYESLLSLLTKQVAKKISRHKHIITREFEARKRIIASLDTQLMANPGTMEMIKAKVETYEQLKGQYKLSDKTLLWRWPVIPGLLLGSILLLAGLPLFLYGLVNNIVAYFIPQKITKLFKDKQFHSSVKFLWGALVVPLLYLIQTIIVLMVIKNSWIAVLYFLSLPITALYAHWFAMQAGFMVNRWRLFFLRKSVPGQMNKLRALMNNIKEEVSTLIGV